MVEGESAGFLPSPDADRPRPSALTTDVRTDADGEARTVLAGYEPPGRCWIPDGSSETGILTASAVGGADTSAGVVGATSRPVQVFLGEIIADAFPPSLTVKNNGGKDDVLRFRWSRSDAGERVRFFRVTPRNQILERLGTLRLGAYGKVRFVAEDRNGRRKTFYSVKVLRSRSTCGSPQGYATPVR